MSRKGPFTCQKGKKNVNGTQFVLLLWKRRNNITKENQQVTFNTNLLGTTNAITSPGVEVLLHDAHIMHHL